MTAPTQLAATELVVGIGNPGNEYADTRHNAGVWFIQALIERWGGELKAEKKFFGKTCTTDIDGSTVRLLVPDTYMNESGKSVAALANFFKIEAAAILVAHDEIDFPTGKVRFKQGGGLAGHNGLRDISKRMAGTTDFNRVRLGVGHPGDQTGVTGHVLGKTSQQDRTMIDECIDEALRALPSGLKGDWQTAMQRLHNVEQPFQRVQSSQDNS